MKQGDYSIRYRLERFRAFYEAAGHAFDLLPTFVNVGFDNASVANLSIPIVQTVRPAKDFPFLWFGLSMQNVGTDSFVVQNPAALQLTILKNAWNLGDGTSADRVLRLSIPLQNLVGYDGKTGFFEYPYLFEAHDQMQVTLDADFVATFTTSELILTGYKVIPRA